MNILKNLVLIASLVTALLGLSTPACAEPSSVGTTAGVSETVAQIEMALSEISKSDFNAAQVHLKAARTSAEKISVNESVVKQANANVIQAQIQAKLGDIQKATEELNKALVLYKSL
jgi:hypothetical protein